MIRKKLMAGLTAFAFIFSTAGGVVPPQPAQAAETEHSVYIYNFTQDTEKVLVFTKGVEAGDVFRVTLTSADGREYSLGAGVIRKYGQEVLELTPTQYPMLKNLRAGDKLTVEIIPERGSRFENTVTLDGVKVKPASMTLAEPTIIKDKRAQTLTVRFDRDYKPSSSDFLQFVPYDKDGKRMDRRDAQEFNILDQDLRTRNSSQELSLRFTPAKEAAYYEVQYVSGNAIADDLTLKIPVGPDFTNPSELLLEYPSTKVKLGETVQPKVYLKNKDGEKMDVTATAVFTYTGVAMEETGRSKGGFTVKKDDKYVGQKIIVTAVAAGRTDTVTLTVADQNGSVEPWNVPGVPRGKTGVIMNINSKEMLINGQKRAIDAPPIIRSDRTFVPLRAVAEAFGAKVTFDEKNYVVKIELDGKTIAMPIGQKNYTVNGQTRAMDVAPYIVSGVDRTMIPVRFAAESMGFKVSTTQNNDGTTASVIFKNY